MKESLIRHVPRVVAVVAALAPAIVAVLDSLPWQWAISLSAVALSLGEAAEKVRRMTALREALTES